MKLHFCLAEQCLLSYEDECNWCGEKEEDTDDGQPAIQITIAPSLEPTPVLEDGEDFPVPIAPI